MGGLLGQIFAGQQGVGTPGQFSGFGQGFQGFGGFPGGFDGWAFTQNQQAPEQPQMAGARAMTTGVARQMTTGVNRQTPTNVLGSLGGRG